jgi:hypothetical protein
MQNKRHSLFAALGFAAIATVALGCGDKKTVDAGSFEGYGKGHPGALLASGGEIWLERVNSPDLGNFGTLNAYFRTWTGTPQDPPALDPGSCYDFSGPTPIPAQEGVEWVDMGDTFTLSAAGKPTITANKRLDQVDNLWRTNAIHYGGAVDAVADTDIEYETHYTVNFTGVEGVNPQPFTMYMPPAFRITTPAIGTQPITLHKNQDLLVQWEPTGQEAGGKKHTPEKAFSFVAFFTLDGTTNMFCPMNDGEIHREFTVPAEFINKLPATGVYLQLGQPTHFMAAFKGFRFDAYAVSCAISPVTVEE